MVLKLILGQISAFVCSSVTFPDIVKSAGYKVNQVVPSFELTPSDFYIAFSKNASTTLVSQWQNAFDQIKLHVSYDAIYRKWFE